MSSCLCTLSIFGCGAEVGGRKVKNFLYMHKAKDVRTVWLASLDKEHTTVNIITSFLFKIWERLTAERKQARKKCTYFIWCPSKLLLDDFTYLIIWRNWTSVQHRLPHCCHVLLRHQILLTHTIKKNGIDTKDTSKTLFACTNLWRMPLPILQWTRLKSHQPWKLRGMGHTSWPICWPSLIYIPPFLKQRSWSLSALLRWTSCFTFARSGLPSGNPHREYS